MGADVSEREALVLVAAGLSPYSRASGRARGGNTVRAVDASTAKGVIAKQGREYIVDPLFGEWIRGQRGRPGG